MRDKDKQREYNRQWCLKNWAWCRDRQLEYQREWRKQNPTKVAEQNRKAVQRRKERSKKHPEAYNARSIVSNALRAGKIIRQPCWCGAKGQAHHTDYSLPLQITWLCKKHHAEAHRKHR